MRTPGQRHALAIVITLALSVSACERARADTAAMHAIVGTWMVHDPNAPFPYHLYVFNADGTMQQANPDAGNPRTSDSDGKGAWVVRGDHVEAKWVELSADRTTRQYAGRLEFTMRIRVSGDSLSATETVSVFDTSGAPAPAPVTSQPLSGTRVTPSRKAVAASVRGACDGGAEANRARVLAFYREALVDRRPRRAFAEYMAADFVEHKPDVPSGTRDSTVAFLEGLIKELPEGRWQILRSLADGDLVFLHASFVPAPGAPPYAIADVFRLQDCKIVEHWDVVGPPVERARNPHSRL